MKENLQNQIENTFASLIVMFSAFKAEQIDLVPFEGSWTAGQVAEHILKSMGNMSHFLSERVVPPQRAYDEKEPLLRQIFLDFGNKMQSPDFIVPVEPRHDKAQLLDQMAAAKEEMLAAAKTLDLAQLCTSFELPQIGALTRYEWLVFFIVHTLRHTHQLSRIAQCYH